MPQPVDFESLVLDQRETIKAMQAEMVALAARLPPAAEPEVVAAKWPQPGSSLLLYKAGHKKGQTDHPGNLVLQVHTVRAYDEAKADGWLDDPLPYDYDKLTEPEPVPVKKVAGKK